MSKPEVTEVEQDTTLAFVWNVPNVLTVLRLVLVPVFAVVLLTHPHSHAWRCWATAVFIVAILTDLADGKIARKYNQVTNFGKIWDSVADKALTGMAFVGLSIIGELSWPVTVVILLREWGITLMRFRVLKYGVMAAKRGGKLKTALQGVALTMFLIWVPDGLTWFWALRWLIMWAAFALTVLTGVDYVFDAYRLRRDSVRVGHPIDYSAGQNR
ncbi:CDP-diacylglycerol--glycerol-3-phosphate 3-phosphatidyltransferase [uncultured Propionibacterium sp.]|uniref:CDP-diacylglycerol--glycerol-3-phosphate 3-phosphatidyltransferase n=1 Tax=uncultured Propionibacterium sp. TaxID=218066 RepID=UPI00292E4597|nr:CDP-diacylglycerol--glycerol-3-phosphate 3-phosphatidyltransferase [uncultured Propionibacterium sp.]